MSGGGWRPDDPDDFGRGGKHGSDEFGADHGQGRYFDQSGYDQSGYDQSGYEQSGYEWSETSGRPQGQGGLTDPYGQRMGRHSGGFYGQDGYGHGAYRQDSYADTSGQGWQFGSRYADDQRGRDGYDQGGYGQGPYDQPGFDSYGEPGYGRDPGPDRYAGEAYGQGGYGQDGYGQARYEGDYYGQLTPGRALPAPEGFGGDGFHQDALGGDSYGRDYGQEGFGSGYQAPGGYQPADSYGRDNGYGAQTGPVRPALGPGSDQDLISSYRPDTGSFDRFDSATNHGATNHGATNHGVTNGATNHGVTNHGGDDLGGRDGWFSQQPETESFGQDAGHAGGYDQWHDGADDADGWDSDEAAEHDGDDWQGEPDGGLLSRRFGSGDDDGRGSGRGSGRRAAKSKRPRRLRGKFATTAAILAGALVLGAVTDFGWERYEAWHNSRYGDYQGAGTGQVRFTVPQGAVLSTLGTALMKAGIIKEVRPFDSAAAAAANASQLQPGVYLLHHHMSSALAVEYLLSAGHRVNDQVTIIEGTRASAIAQALAKQTGIPVSQFTEIIDHPPASLGLPSWAQGKTAEGFLFPDTYQLLPKMTALQILQKMVTEFKQKIAAINLVGVARAKSTTPWHALIVASMIQAEAGSPKDFGKISRVVWNRLRDNMPLEFDSTVFYAMGKYGTAVNASQRNFPSPYNTYLHTGLPPGPIENPGIAAINAAVHAPDGQWLYFITDTRHKPYHTYFYDTLAELQAAQRKFGN